MGNASSQFGTSCIPYPRKPKPPLSDWGTITMKNPWDDPIRSLFYVPRPLPLLLQDADQLWQHTKGKGPAFPILSCSRFQSDRARCKIHLSPFESDGLPCSPPSEIQKVVQAC